MIRIDTKPLSVNQCWQGKRFKTEKYKSYERLLLFTLPKIVIPEEGELSVYYEFGFSSSASDIDNPIKPFQDILQKKYGFNDSRIWKMEVVKVKVKKGEEYVKFQIKER